MALTRLEVLHLRNLTKVIIEPAQTFNLIYGENGSGKTSLLEAIYLLGLGRSFRSRNVNHLIQAGMESVTVFGILQENTEWEIPLGIERHKDGTIQIRVQQHNVLSIAELAHYLPIQLINQDSYQLLLGSPKFRRQFIDWALFHVEQSFFTLWKRFQRSLQQRNAALRNKASIAELKLWDKEYIDTALQLDTLRKQLLQQYITVFKPILNQLSDINEIELIYRQGWNSELTLEQAVAESIVRDRQFGFTHDGPHRADLDIKVGKTPASQFLSRGQQKVLTYSLLLAQGQLLAEKTERKCIYLIDDMPAELDQNHISAVLKQLDKMQAQIFITCVEPASINSFLTAKGKMFHVEHGQVIQN